MDLKVGQRGRGPGKRAAGPPSLLADETLMKLIDVYGQISLPVHVTDAAKMLKLLMR